MGGLRRIFDGMAEIMAMEEADLATKIEQMVGEERGAASIAENEAGEVGASAEGSSFIEDGAGANATPNSGESATEGLATASLIELQYDVQRFSIFNNITTNTMQSVAGAYQGITGNLNFR